MKYMRYIYELKLSTENSDQRQSGLTKSFNDARKGKLTDAQSFFVKELRIPC